MTTERQERRTAGVNRVQVARIVDICGRDQTVPAFEAQSVELSGRGMQVRTPYLPPLGAPLVCRLEDGGREIVVEGVVAWQRDRDGGGEFGVQFTALDSGSVEALKCLCGLEPRAATEAPTAKREVVSAEATAAVAPSGTPVKLHIDGLGAPMKARVKTGSVRKLQVGSNLEFLKVGRGLEVEDVEQGERRGARIDSVSIAIDPETQVPQLVVMLRYAGEDTTPEPSVVDDDEDEPRAGSVAELRAAAASEASEPASVDDAADSNDDDHDADDAAAMRGRVDAFAVNVGRAAKNTSDKLAVAGGAAAAGFARWMKDKSGRLGEMAKKRAKGAQKKRSTAPAPATTTSSGQQRLRPQNGGGVEAALADPKRRKVLIGAGAGVALILAVGAMALSGRSNKPISNAPATGVAAATQDSVPATPGALPALGASPGALAATPPAMAAAPADPGTVVAPGVPGQRPGVVANVPLFGPTPMATLEPAPLGPAPDQIAPLTPTAAAAQQPATEERMDDDDKGSSNDESFGSSSKDKDKKDKSPEALAEAAKPFVQGKLHLPLLHRLKLDKPGAAIQGKKDVAGFTVIIPGRKVEGGGASIAKRDDRISEVRTKNGPGGAQISFIFRSKIPGYKVRLKKSSVEFFISSPDGAK
ncbi:MAG TPA: PilZ domain-containing protein [Polyangiaceae bacterium]